MRWDDNDDNNDVDGDANNVIAAPFIFWERLEVLYSLSVEMCQDKDDRIKMIARMG